MRNRSSSIRRFPAEPRRHRKKKQLKFINAIAARKIPAGFYLGVFIMFMAGLLILISSANVTLQRNANFALESELRSLQQYEAQLMIQLTHTRDLEIIEYLARTRLNMSESAAHQIMPITLPPPAEIVVDFTVMPVQELTWQERTRDLLRGFFRFFTRA